MFVFVIWDMVVSFRGGGIYLVYILSRFFEVRGFFEGRRVF